MNHFLNVCLLNEIKTLKNFDKNRMQTEKRSVNFRTNLEWKSSEINLLTRKYVISTIFHTHMGLGHSKSIAYTIT